MVWGFVRSFYDKYAPEVVKHFVHSIDERILLVKTKIQARVDKIKQIFVSAVAVKIAVEKIESEVEGDDEDQPGAISKILARVSGIVNNLKEYFLEKLGKIQTYIKSITFLKIFTVVIAFLLLNLRRWKEWFLSLAPTTLALVCGMTIVVVTAVATIATSGTKIYRGYSDREPASLAPMKRGRPSYYKGEKKQLIIQNLRLPIYIQSLKDIRMLTMDVTLHSTNRNIIRFLKDREHIIRDLLISKIEPIMPAFSLLPEGKGILKDQIRKEISRYLQKNKVEGKIKSIYVEYLMGV